MFSRSDAVSAEDAPSERSTLEQFFDEPVVDFAVEPRLMHVRIRRAADDAALALETLEAWVARGDDSSGASRLTWRPRDAAQYLVITSIEQETIAFYSSRTNASSSMRWRDSTSASAALRLPALAVNISLVGSGFHRRVAIDVDTRSLHESLCALASSKLLLRVPLSHNVYADLDELRVRASRVIHFRGSLSLCHSRSMRCCVCDSCSVWSALASSGCLRSPSTLRSSGRRPCRRSTRSRSSSHCTYISVCA